MDAIEGSKENVIPLKKGRKLDVMNFTSFPSKEEKKLKDKGEKAFEQRLIDSGDDLNTKLDIYVEYYTWIRRSSSSNLVGARNILEVRSSISCVTYPLSQNL